MKELFYRLFLAETHWLTYTTDPAFTSDGTWFPPDYRARKPTRFGLMLYRIYHALPAAKQPQDT